MVDTLHQHSFYTYLSLCRLFPKTYKNQIDILLSVHMIQVWLQVVNTKTQLGNQQRIYFHIYVCTKSSITMLSIYVWVCICNVYINVMYTLCVQGINKNNIVSYLRYIGDLGQSRSGTNSPICQSVCTVKVSIVTSSIQWPYLSPSRGFRYFYWPQRALKWGLISPCRHTGGSRPYSGYIAWLECKVDKEEAKNATYCDILWWFDI